MHISTLLRRSLISGVALAGIAGTGMAVNSFLPRRLPTWYTPDVPDTTLPDSASFPAIEVSFLRCGSVTIPPFIAARGTFSITPCTISHNAVLIRHPKATFLYDTGLSSDIYLYLRDQSLFFRKVLANFNFEQSLGSHLEQLEMRPRDLDFAVISHLHWDHVSGLPDIPGVPLRINRVEYEWAKLGMLDANNGIVRSLLDDAPIELFDCNGPAYEGFHSSFDLFGDGSIVLVPLPGHTPGNTGMFINRSNGSRVFLLGDAVWVAENFQRPTTMHPFVWSPVTSDDATACQTLIDLHHFSHRHPEIAMIAMHDGAAQKAFMHVEATHLTHA